mgnify:CR=1 FL=1
MANKPQIRNRFSERAPVHPPKGEGSLTKQDFAEEANINNLVARHLGGGTFERPRGVPLQMPGASRQPIFGDFSSSMDYQSQLDRLNDARQAFMDLPARFRGRFNNNPRDLIRWLEDPKNHEQARKYGLLPSEDPLDGKDQLDLMDELEQEREAREVPPKASEPPAPKADDEANPRQKKPT